jgi:hypothetical protein
MVLAQVSPVLPARAEPGPVRQPTAATVTADALPTAQINGVVWTQVIAGNTVFAGGEFTSVRPAGTAPGPAESPRSNLMSYDIRTGVHTDFAPTFNGPIRALALSPDGETLYVGGQFTSVDGRERSRLAAFSVATGALTELAPAVNSTVRAIAVIGRIVYFGGTFNAVDGVSRGKLAAVDANSRALTGWAPTADSRVEAMVATPNRTRVVVAGAFGELNSASAPGMGSLDAANGAVRPWSANTVVKDYGDQAAILTLSADSDTIYGGGYTYGSGELATGNFEGAFAADPVTGNLRWLQDCHGDTYDVAPVGDSVYSIGHAHFCRNMGGFPDTNPRTGFHRALAVTKQATGTVSRNTQPGSAYGNFAGQPAPSLYNWFPALEPGGFTGFNQAAWDVTANARYVTLGGEFIRVNDVAQQGLVRFALPAEAPNAMGPQETGSTTAPTASVDSGRSVALSWLANWDRDDQVLTYEVLRNDVVIHTLTATSQFWRRPTLRYVDAHEPPGVTYSYRIRVRDPHQNTVISPSTSAIVPSDPAYTRLVTADGATHQWRLGGPDGQSTDPDSIGRTGMSLLDGVRLGAAGALLADRDTAAIFAGTATAVGRTEMTSQPAGTRIEAWFKTSGSAGGALVGFGVGDPAGPSAPGDRQLYLDGAGRLSFAVRASGTGAALTVTSPAGYRDARWHHVVATQTARNVTLYVDGSRVAAVSRPLTMPALSGVWTLGGATPTDLPGASAARFLGVLDEVSVSSSTLTPRQVYRHFRTGAARSLTEVGAGRR